MDVIKCEPDPREEMYLTCSHNDSQQNDVAQSEGSVLMGVSVMKTENEVIMDFIKSEPHSHGELYVTASQGGNEMIDVKEEEDSVTVQAVKAEQETVKLDEELEDISGVQTDFTNEPCKSGAALKEYERCEQNFGISNDLCSEANSSDNNRLIYSCDVCKNVVSGENELKTHSVLCTRKCPYTFDTCKNSSCKRNGFERQQHVYLKECPPYHTCKESCSECSLVNITAVHDGRRPYSCETCDKAFKHPSDLKKHVLVHTGERPYTCNTCDKTFNQTSVLKRHMRVHTRNFSHRMCKKCFISDCSHLTITAAHSGRRPYLCEICDKAFKHPSDLKTHLRIHTGERPYSCNICDKAFNQSSVLKRHMRVHTEQHSCHTCKKCSDSDCSHLKITAVHNGRRPYLCEICDKAFRHPSDLKKHLRIHTGERPYSCNTCDKAFNQSSVLKRHMRMHTGELTFCI
ncbi:hypothetical protein Cfor_05537 [Coptotermes formosanus]|uniref:C2H2-type domain-containing protein n=1 Tax=Coptotermes formosanus TaxID=36987 RepID=A0A6L2PRL5_COPFO|nr:hypothetical protein Cfor_05537 [Coptotermes formosanus]